MAKLIMIFFMCLMAMSVSNCSTVKYGAPSFEDCTVISSWSEQKETDVATCFCIDEQLTQKNFPQLLEYTKSVYKEHPQMESVVAYLSTNAEEIIKTKEYELPVHYCRGYSAIGPKARTDLTKWAETNRMKRIECELELEK